jgi:CubicO group peptidase (beta-lactamase class C family)
MLLRATAPQGQENAREPVSEIRISFPEKCRTRLQLVEFFAYLKNDTLMSLPGERAEYSNQAFNLLGFALQNKTGMSYEDVVRTLITEPLGLNSTSFSTPPASRAIIPPDKLSSWFDVDLSNFKPYVTTT